MYSMYVYYYKIIAGVAAGPSNPPLLCTLTICMGTESVMYRDVAHFSQRYGKLWSLLPLEYNYDGSLSSWNITTLIINFCDHKFSDHSTLYMYSALQDNCSLV